MPRRPASGFLTNPVSLFAVRAFVLVLFFGVLAVGSAYAGITIQPTTWNVIGLDSNDPAAGADTYQIGARVCNTGGAPVSNVVGTFVWDSTNAYINLSGNNPVNVSSLNAGACTDFYFPVTITRTALAYDTARRYHITASATGFSAVSTPTPRELYVEHLVSQNRNSVLSIIGPSTVYVGQTYNYTVNAKTATGGYEQLEAFLNLSNVIFQVVSIATTYTEPPGATNDKFYSDACGWNNDPLSPTYRSCIVSNNKAGGVIATTYTVRIISTGVTTASTLIYDFSGSSYHYNNDYGKGINAITITSLAPPLTLTKIANPTTATAGATVTYTLRVTNTGTPSYTLTDFVDTPPTSPATPTYVSGSSTFNGSPIPNPVSSGSTRTWSGSFVVPAGQTRDLTYQMVMPNTPGTYNNSAIAHVNEFQIDTTQSTTDNAPATASVTVPPPDLTITKSHSGNFTQGQVGATYSITATNSGASSTSGTVTVTDNLPTGLTVTAIPTGTGWNCSTTVVGSTTATCTRSDALGAGASYPAITLAVTVANNAPASVTNSVTVSGGGQTNTGNDSASDPTTINGVADLGIAKSHSGNFTVGVNGTYTLTASNSGTVATSGTITVIDNLPAGLTVAAIPTGTGWNCSTTVVGSSTATCTSATVIAGGATSPNPITLNVVVAAAAFPSVTNSATISGGGEPAFNSGNNTVTDPTTVNGVSDVRLAKSHSGNFTVGVNGIYTLTASNSGTLATSGTITVVDNLPAGLTVAAIPTPVGWNCGTTVVGSSTMTCTSSTVIAAGGSNPNTISLSVVVAPAAFPSVTNSANISGGGEPAYNNGNNTVTDPTTVNGVADVQIAKSHSGNFTVGVNGTYTLTASNSGTLATSGTITVVDNLPAGLTVAAIPTPVGWNCGTTVVGSSTMTCTSSTVISAGGSNPNTISLSVVVAPAAFPSATNSATISGGGEPPYNNGNNTVTDPTTVNGVADVRIAKSHSGNFTVGVNGTYTLTASNSGTLATSGSYTVVDNLPAGLTVAAIPTPVGWNCGTTVVGSSTMTCTSSTVIAAGGSNPNTISLSVVVAPAAFPSVTNSASISGGGEPAYNNGNNTVTDPTTVDGVADLRLAKSHSGNFTVGVNGTYTLTASNSGTAATSGTYTVVDNLPAGLTVAAIPTPVGWNCGTTVVGSSTMTCTSSTVISAGGSNPNTISLSVVVAPAAFPSATNSATISGGGEPAYNNGNNTVTDPTTVNGVADVRIAKSHSGNFTVGVNGTYTLTASNSGTLATSGSYTVVDNLPAGLTVAAIPTPVGWNCGTTVVGSSTMTCTSSTVIAAGGSNPNTISLSVVVAPAAFPSVTNSATISGGGEPAYNNGNNTVTDPTTVNGVPDLTIAKTHSGNFTQGQVGAQYTITVTNSGTAGTDGSAVTVIDILPAGLTATGISGAVPWNCNLGTLTCTRNDVLNAGASYSPITLTVNVAINAPASVTNSVSVSGGGETNTSNDSADDATTIDAGPPLVNLVKSVNPPGSQVPGVDLTYTIDYTNNGGKPAQNFVIIDPNPLNADPLERVFHNLDFKLGSMTSSPPSGLSASFSYSNDGGVNWTYTPVSGGGGAPAGYDRNVTNIRWTFTGNLATSANGNVSFIARIR